MSGGCQEEKTRVNVRATNVPRTGIKSTGTHGLRYKCTRTTSSSFGDLHAFNIKGVQRSPLMYPRLGRHQNRMNTAALRLHKACIYKGKRAENEWDETLPDRDLDINIL